MTRCDDCGELTGHPLSRPDVSSDWTVCPHCDRLRTRKPAVVGTFDVRLARAISGSKPSEYAGRVCVVLQQDVADALSTIAALRRTHDERTQAIRVLAAQAAGAKS